jgi:ubiquinone/menaquinone biosynthesis C-methylase UbiE
MKILISFCNQPRNSKNNLLLLDVETGKREYLLETGDSFTGITQDEDFFYALSQNLKGIFIIEKKTKKIILQQRLSELSDPHSMIIDENRFLYIVSTGNDKVLKYFFDKKNNKVKLVEKIWNPKNSDGSRDTHHLNAIFKEGKKIYISAFGLREIEGKSNSAKNGYILELNNNKKIYKDIYHPHSIFINKDKFYYCESAKQAIMENDKILFPFEEGYIRGLTIESEKLFVGVSNRRKVSKSTGLLNVDSNIEKINESCKLVIFNLREKNKMKEIDFFPLHQEIYDILVVSEKKSSNEKKLKEDFTFGQYGRYVFIRDVINFNRKKDENFKILDVGGRGNNLIRFISEDRVIYLDPFVESKDENFIKGDGCSIPLDDESFDWVVSTDVFEHIEHSKREIFIRENLRVSKFGIILTAPFYSKEVVASEKKANEDYRILFGEDHVWLKEHIDNGLPREKELENFLNENKISFYKICNNQLLIWKLMQSIHFIVLKVRDKNVAEEFEKLNYFINKNINHFYENGESYRKIYVIKKREEVEIPKSAKNEHVDNDIQVKIIDKLNTFFSNLVKRNYNKISELELNILKKKAKINELDKKEEQIRRLEEKILFLESSKFWRVRNFYLKIKSLLLNSGTNEFTEQRNSNLEKYIKDNDIEFIDFGASKGGSIEFAKKHFCEKSGRGVGIDIDQKKIDEMKEKGYDAFYGDVTEL